MVGARKARCTIHSIRKEKEGDDSRAQVKAKPTKVSSSVEVVFGMVRSQHTLLLLRVAGDKNMGLELLDSTFFPGLIRGPIFFKAHRAHPGHT